MSEPEFDLIAVGGGFAGLTAAARAADLGLKTLVLERDSDDRYFCNSRITSGVFHVASNNVRLGADELIAAIEIETAGYAKPELVRAIAENAGKTVEWLRAAGVKFEARGVGYVNMRQHLVLAPPRRMRAGLDWEGRGGDYTLRPGSPSRQIPRQRAPRHARFRPPTWSSPMADSRPTPACSKAASPARPAGCA